MKTSLTALFSDRAATCQGSQGNVSAVRVAVRENPSWTGPTVLSCFVQKINPKPTDFQPSYRNTHGRNDGWFKARLITDGVPPGESQVRER